MLTIAIILALLVIIAVATVAGILLWLIIQLSNEGFADIADLEGADDETRGQLDL